jgi:LysM repeat protein
MKSLNIILTILLIFSLSNTYAQFNNTEKIPSQLLVQFDDQNNPYILVQMVKNSSLYSICKTFKIKESDVYKINPDLRKDIIRENEWIKLPLSEILTYNEESNLPNCLSKVFYQVKPKETLFEITRHKTKIKLKELKELNKLGDDNLKQGQLIQIGWIIRCQKPETTILKQEPEKTTSLDLIDATKLPENLPIKQARSGKEVPLTQASRGVGVCLTSNHKTSDLLALHAKARRNSLIEIHNPITGKTVLAKVIGKIPKNYPKEVQVVVSREVARELLIVDSKFFVYLKFGI